MLNRMQWRVRWMLVLLLFPFALRADYEDIREAFRGFRVIFVSGYTPADDGRFTFGVNEAYRQTAAMMREMGLDAVLSKAPGGSSKANGDPILIREILESPKPVILVGHSNGGNRTLRVAVGSEASSNVAGTMLVQSPVHGIFGAELAMRLLEPEIDWLKKHDQSLDALERFYQRWQHLDRWRVLQWTLGVDRGRRWNLTGQRLVRKRTEAFYRMFHGGDLVVLEELTVAEAGGFYDANVAEIEALSQRIPVLSVTSSGKSKMFCALQLALQKMGYETDGVVELTSHRLGFGTVVSAGEVDHLQLIFQNKKFQDVWAGFFREMARSPLFRAIH